MRPVTLSTTPIDESENGLAITPREAARHLLALSTIVAAVLAGCANYAGIHSDKEMALPTQIATAQSLPSEGGHWPATDWASQFGDAQLKALIDEALAGSPSIEKARARIAAAVAFSESANANTLPQVGAGYSWTRQRLTESTFIPPAFAGTWQSENKAIISASYELDLWGKNREALRSAVSMVHMTEAEAEQVRLTLSQAIARSYNELARLYALLDIARDEVTQREESCGSHAVGSDGTGYRRGATDCRSEPRGGASFRLGP
jgi:outer membrane protein TolC